MAPLVPYLASVAVGVGLGVGITRPWRRIAAGARATVDRVLRRTTVSAFRSVHPDELEWRRNQEHQAETTFYMKLLGRADEMGRALMLVRYPVGEINPAHEHSRGHGMYVLQGRLATHRGSFGPGTFVWFPPREVMWHGAGSVEDVVVLFLTAPDMTTRYVKDEPRLPDA